MGEAYCKNILFATSQDTKELESQNGSAEVDLNHLTKINDPVFDIYDYHNTKEYMSKQTSEKLEIRHSLFENLPARLTTGSGHWRF
jgi:hypothetical protein